MGIEPTQVQREEKEVVGRLVVRYETGRLTSDEFFEELGDLFQHRYTREHLLKAWNAIIKEENYSIVPIVEAIQASHKSAVLSNTSPTHIRKALETTTILQKFPKRYLSFEIGAVKPDRAIFDFVIRDLSDEPATIALIDDVAENVRAAEECGMVGILFTDLPNLRRDLRKFGILA